MNSEAGFAVALERWPADGLPRNMAAASYSHALSLVAREPERRCLERRLEETNSR